MLEQKFANNLKSYMNKINDNKILLTISGGKDSIALLDAFHKFKDYLAFEIHVAHFNHLLRGEDSDNDANFVRELCQKYGISFHYDRYDTTSFAKENKLSIEEAARIKRYAFFARVADENNIATITTAHHADDQIETVLLRLLHGSCSDSLGGMSIISPLFCDPSITIFRPFLSIWKWEIEKYIKTQELSFREDKTNQENRYFRNRIRNKLIPLLCEEFTPALKDNIFQISQVYKEDSNYIYQELEKYSPEIKFKDNQLTINLSTMPEAPSLRKRMLLKLVKGYFNEDDVLTFHGINALEILLEQNKASFSIDLKHNYLLLKNQNMLTIKPKDDGREEFQVTIDKAGEVSVDIINKVFTFKQYEKSDNFLISKMNNPIHLDADKVKFPITIRSRQKGDSFMPYGSHGTKKLKDYLIDKKINRFQRWQIPVICDADNNIIWIGYYQIDERFKIDADSKNILEISIRKIR